MVVYAVTLSPTGQLDGCPWDFGPSAGTTRDRGEDCRFCSLTLPRLALFQGQQVIVVFVVAVFVIAAVSADRNKRKTTKPMRLLPAVFNF